MLKIISHTITSLKLIILTPFTNLLIILITALSIFLATTSYVLWLNIEPLNKKWNESAEISLYLKKNTNSKDIENLVKNLQSHPAITTVEFIRPAEGMKLFTEDASLKMLLTSFKENPLPNVIKIYPQVKILSNNATLELIKELNNLPEVETVKADLEWIERSYNLFSLWNNLVWFFIFLLSINMLLIIGGGSYLYAKISTQLGYKPKALIPYQYAWLGLISSLLALFWFKLILIIMQNHGLTLLGLTMGWSMVTILISIFLGFICARIGVKHS